MPRAVMARILAVRRPAWAGTHGQRPHGSGHFARPPDTLCRVPHAPANQVRPKASSQRVPAPAGGLSAWASWNSLETVGKCSACSRSAPTINRAPPNEDE